MCRELTHTAQSTRTLSAHLSRIPNTDTSPARRFCAHIFVCMCTPHMHMHMHMHMCMSHACTCTCATCACHTHCLFASSSSFCWLVSSFRGSTSCGTWYTVPSQAQSPTLVGLGLCPRSSLYWDTESLDTARLRRLHCVVVDGRDVREKYLLAAPRGRGRGRSRGWRARARARAW